MKNTLTLLLIFAASLLYGQAIEGGGGVCHVSGDPNDVAALEVQDVRAECFLVVDTTSGALYVYDPTGTVGSRWVVFSGSDGNGIISALPAGDVSIAAAGNDLNISGLGDYLIETDNYSVGSHPDFLNPGFPEFIGLRVFGQYGSGWFENDSVYSVGLRPSFGSGLHRAFYFDPTGSNIQVVNFGTGSTNFQGLIYSSDFSADFVDRSLVDKAYVDGVVGGGGSGAYPTVADTTGYATNQTAVLGEIILMDVTSGALTVTPPASPSKGERFGVSDVRANSGANNITVNFTTQRILGGAQNYIINSNGAYAEFEYVAPGTGWIPAKPGGGGSSGGGGGLPLVVFEEKTADYTLAADDHGKTIEMRDVSNIRTFTIPNNATVPIPVGTRIELTSRSGESQSQQVRIEYQSGVVRRTYIVPCCPSSDDLVVKNAGIATLTKVGTDTWIVHGDLGVYDAGMP